MSHTYKMLYCLGYMRHLTNSRWYFVLMWQSIFGALHRVHPATIEDPCGLQLTSGAGSIVLLLGGIAPCYTVYDEMWGQEERQ